VRRAGYITRPSTIPTQSVALGSTASLAVPDTMDQQRPTLHLAAKVPHRELTGFAPVPVAAPCDPMPTLFEVNRPAGGAIQVELPFGGQLRLTGAVDEAALRRVLSALW
jgi:hypothetical protein